MFWARLVTHSEHLYLMTSPTFICYRITLLEMVFMITKEYGSAMN